jgi:hypothetical protein
MGVMSRYSRCLLVAAAAIAAAVFIVISSASFPDVGATHFDAHGQANASMSRGVYRGYMVFLVFVVPLFLAAMPAFVARRWPMLLNIPNREYWLAPERITETVASLGTRTAVLAIAMILLICFVHVLVLGANAVDQAELDQQALLSGLAAFIVFVVGWIVSLCRRFRRPGT